MEDDQTDYDKVFKMWEKKDEGRISKKSLLDSPEPTTLPFVDIHYDLKSLTQLFCKPGKSISVRLSLHWFNSEFVLILHF